MSYRIYYKFRLRIIMFREVEDSFYEIIYQ